MSSYYDVIDFKGSGNSLLPGTTALTQDSVNFNGPYFYSSDLFGADTAVSTAGPLNFGGFGLNAGFSLPSNYTGTDLINHPGVAFVQSTGSLNPLSARAPSFSNNQYFVIFPNPPPMSFTYIFKTPATTSNASDRFQMIIGACAPSNSTLVDHGWSVTYSDIINSGRWQFNEHFNGAVLTSGNGTLPFVHNTWMRLNIAVATTNNLTVNLTVCGTTTTTGNLIFSGLSNRLNGGNALPIDPMGMNIQKTINTTGYVVGFVTDYFSMTIGTTGRVW